MNGFIRTYMSHILAKKGVYSIYSVWKHIYCKYSNICQGTDSD